MKIKTFGFVALLAVGVLTLAGCGKAEAPVEITLSDTIPFLSLEELDDIVKILTEQDILKAVTKDGKDITDQVKAEYRRISPRGNAYEVTFSVEYDGKTKEHVETAYVIN